MIKSAVKILATWIWESDINGKNDISTEFHFENIFPLAMKMLGVYIILSACLNKAPLIINIVSNKSVGGMSVGSVYSETIMYSNSALYSILRGFPFTLYGETVIKLFQSMIVCVLSWIYSETKISVFNCLTVIVIYFVYLFGVFSVLTPDYYFMLKSVNLPVIIFSKGSQIYKFFICKHTGTQSLTTTGMNISGNVIRIVNMISEIGFDIPMLSGSTVSLVLNSILIVQFLMYKKNTKEYLTSLKKKAD